VPGERVWFWVMPASGSREDPLPVEAVTDALGIARVRLTLDDRPRHVRILAEVVNVSPPEGSGVKPVELSAVALPPTSHLAHHLQGLESPAAEVRRAAAKALGELGPTASAAERALILVGGDPDAGVRFHAAEALAKLDSQAAVAALVAVLRERDGVYRQQAAAILGRLRPPDEAAVRALAVLAGKTSRRDYAHRLAAIAALGSLGAAASAALPTLVVASRDPDPSVRRFAIIALWRMRSSDPSVIAALAKAAEDPDHQVSRAAKRALAHRLQPGSEARLALVTGEEGPVESGVMLPMSVKLTGAGNEPLRRQRVLFRVTRGRATLSRSSALTDDRGVASTLVAVDRGAEGWLELEAAYESRVVTYKTRVLRR
jgi:HEAT repeat protein